MGQTEILEYLEYERKYGNGVRDRYISVVKIHEILNRKNTITRTSISRACQKLHKYNLLERAYFLIGSTTHVCYRYQL